MLGAPPIPFAIYKNDMDDLGTQARVAMEKMAEDQKHMLRTVWLLVNAAGGKVAIHDSDAQRYDRERAEIEWSRNEHDMTTEYVARLKPVK